MGTKHSITAGAVLTLENGSTAHAQTKFEQDVSIHPETGKPLNTVTSLEQQVIVLDEKGKRHIASLVPLEDGSGIMVLFQGRNVYKLLWR